MCDIPIVVFTGKELVAEEEARLRTVAKSIVLKDVQSPDRLFDETALFLHRVVANLPEAKRDMLVRLMEGPLDLGGRQALLLESAGDKTLAQVLRSRERLSLDLLERWGTDLLEALTDLDRAGVDHRDIKPANLGVREGRGDRAKHLVLFDFSLSRAGATAVTAGTHPYLDPFLDAPERGRQLGIPHHALLSGLPEIRLGTLARLGVGCLANRGLSGDGCIYR